MSDENNANDNEPNNIINLNQFFFDKNPEYFEPSLTSIETEDGDFMEVYTDAPWWLDNYHMHDKFGFHEAVGKMDENTLRTMLKFRIDFLQEELDEMKNAVSAEDVVDALIDLCVVAIGTLDAFDVDAQQAWDEVHQANMAKERGIKPNRPNPLGLPDLIKPDGWVAPSHVDNHGILDRIDYTGFADLFK
jgi:predicted HAD superfamily Cof-like phosphohydrolase